MVAVEEKLLVAIETRALAEFSVSPEDVAARVEEFRDLHIVPADPKSYKAVKAAYMVLVHLRNKVDQRRKDLGEEARKWTNALGAAAKKLINPTAPLEARLKGEIDAEDARVAAIEKERINSIKAKIFTMQAMGRVSPSVPADELREQFLNLFELDIDDSFQEFQAEAQAAKDSSITLIKEAIVKREAWEKEETDRKAEAELLEKIRKEQEAERKRLDEEKRKLQEEKDRLEAGKRAEADAKAKAERETKEQEFIKEANERKVALAPDKEKLLVWVELFSLNVPRPELKTDEAQTILYDALHALDSWLNDIRFRAEKL